MSDDQIAEKKLGDFLKPMPPDTPLEDPEKKHLVYPWMRKAYGDPTDCNEDGSLKKGRKYPDGVPGTGQEPVVIRRQYNNEEAFRTDSYKDGKPDIESALIRHREKLNGVLIPAGLNLQDASMDRTRGRETEWSDIQGEGSSWKESNLRYAVFKGCVLKNTSFWGADLRHVHFVDCDLSGADISGAQIDEVQFVNCNVEGLKGLWTAICDEETRQDVERALERMKKG